uniref:Uncharacterized protein n=1 Tax=Rhizophora mucronata TaxID=61149 RepID=A0A2P2PUN8_RHIMU
MPLQQNLKMMMNGIVMILEEMCMLCLFLG